MIVKMRPVEMQQPSPRSARFASRSSRRAVSTGSWWPVRLKVGPTADIQLVRAPSFYITTT